MLHSVSLLIQNIGSQENIFAYLVTLPICIINTLPFLTLLFPLSKKQSRIIMVMTIAVDTALIILATSLTHQLIYDIGYDTWMHLAIIQRGIENGLFAGEPYYAGYPNTLHYSIVDVFYMLLSKITGISPLTLWGNLSIMFAPLIFLVCIMWYKELFGDLRLGWLAGLLFMLSISTKWHFATYTRNIAFIFFFLSLLFYFRSAKQKRYILYCGISFGFCIMSHLFTGVMCFTFLIAHIFLTWGVDAIHRKKRLWIEDFKRLLFIPVGGIVASPWLTIFGKQALTHTEISTIHYFLPDWHIQANILGWVFTIYKPNLFFGIYQNILWILASVGFFICLYHIIRGNYKPIHIFLVTAAVIPVLVLLTPFYMTIVHIFGEWMPSRFVKVMSVPPLAALGCGMIIRFLNDLRVNHKMGKSIVVNSSGIILGLIFMATIISFVVKVQITQKDFYTNRYRLLTPLDMCSDDLSSLKDMIRDRVVLTDPITSYFLTYYTSAYVVAIPPAHGSPYINHEARNADVLTIFDPDTDSAKRYELLDKYQVKYVMLNLRAKTENIKLRGVLINMFCSNTVKENFDKQDRFKLIYDLDGLLVYKYE
jgi:hypothetical protein